MPRRRTGGIEEIIVLIAQLVIMPIMAALSVLSIFGKKKRRR